MEQARWAWMAILAVSAAESLAAQSSDCAKERTLLRARFGSNVDFVPGQQTCAVTGDFNRDRKPDIAMLARPVTASPPPATLVATANPWKPSRAARWTKGSLALAVVLEGPSPRLFLLTDPEFFSTPIWAHPVKLISRLERPKGGADRIAVATEGGPDLQLYWSGSAWKMEVPNEEP